jgi:hypothetical protein
VRAETLRGVPFAHLSGPRGAFIEFGIMQYQFPDMELKPDNKDDLNWLRVQFRVCDGERRWSRNDPAWQTNDLPGLAAWLRLTADGQVPTDAWTATEPLLTLVCERASPTIELVAELRLELHSDDARMSNLDWDNPESIRLEPTSEELLNSADVLDEAIRRLPPR